MRVPFLRTVIVGLTLMCLASIGMMAQGNPEAAKLENPVPISPESIVAGQQVFQRYCQACHGATAEGGSSGGGEAGATPPNLTDKEWKYGSSDGEIFNTVKNGVLPNLFMEPWGDRIDDTNIWSVVNYIRSLAKDKVANP